MRLYAAIRHEGEHEHDKEGMITSVFNGNATSECCWYDLIQTALTHVSHGDVKRVKDCWISTSKRLATAINYLNNPKYDFTGIAVFDLHATKITGEIYDETLKDFGYIERIIDEKGRFENQWHPNADGVVATLDLSDAPTVAYICSFLWLKGGRKASGNIRALRYAKNDDEVLLLGENIAYTYYPRNQVISLLNEKREDKAISSLYRQLFSYIYANGPLASAEVLMGYDKSELPIPIEEYIAYGSENGYVPKGSLDVFERVSIDSVDVDDKERMTVLYFAYLKKHHREQLMKYYRNIVYHFVPEKAMAKFTEYHHLSYADKDIIDFEKYEPVAVVGEIDFDEILYAYVYSLCYYMLKDEAKESGSTKQYLKNFYYMINEAYDRRFLTRDLHEEEFLTYYNHSLGLYVKREREVDWNRLDLETFFS